MSESSCILCGTPFEDKESYQRHLDGKEHKFHQDLQKASKESQHLHFSVANVPSLNNIIVRKNTPKSFLLKITTTSPKPVTILSAQTDPKISDVAFTAVCPCKFTSSTTVCWEIISHCNKEGILLFPILIKTENQGEIQNYAVELVFHVHGEFFDDLHPVEPFKGLPPKNQDNSVVYIVDDHLTKSKEVIPMQSYPLPTEMVLFLNNNLKPFDGITKHQKAQLKYIENLVNNEDKRKSLTEKRNYTGLLEMLLYAEEHQMLRNMRMYDQPEQSLQKVGNLVELQVPDLSEGRPSVLVSDTIRLKDDKNSKIIHSGIVKKVNESSVLIKFPKSFMKTFTNNKKFHVSFSFNRYTIRAQHQAVDFARSDNIDHFFFEKTVPKSTLDLNLRWFNEDIAQNAEQQQAVRAIVRQSAMPTPYLIFGPPGTGKTMTVVEAVKQIHARGRERVLICTPSNSAANEIMKRLVDTVPQSDLFRLVSMSFADFMPKELRRFCNYRRGLCYQPSMSELLSYRIIITTLVSAARLVNKGCPEKHFSYVFIDEAGQATESETLIAISRILSSWRLPGRISGQIVLAGDPRQLGPIVQSSFAKQCGFDTSMLERLMDTCKQYQKDKGKTNPSALTKLLKNYRSHRVILHQPNSLFYENELQVAGDDLINTALNWEFLPNKNFPMLFHSVVGVDQREKTSPSFFNIQEIQVVMDYLEKLINCRMNRITINESHIAVISPYKKQVEKFKQAFHKKNYNNILVGSVEQIQGQERMIVIISTVRSKPHLLNYDSRFNLGFLTNPKRFNVAITRAKALLIIVGNPHILQLDQYWKSLITYCRDNGAVTGDKFEFHDENASFNNGTSTSALNGSDSGEGTSCSLTDI